MKRARRFNPEGRIAWWIKTEPYDNAPLLRQHYRSGVSKCVAGTEPCRVTDVVKAALFESYAYRRAVGKPYKSNPLRFLSYCLTTKSAFGTGYA